jgi:hypothetical protein
VNWTWEANVIWRNFIAPEADAIMNIPLCHGGGEDLGLGFGAVGYLHYEVILPVPHDAE